MKVGSRTVGTKKTLAQTGCEHEHPNLQSQEESASGNEIGIRNRPVVECGEKFSQLSENGKIASAQLIAHSDVYSLRGIFQKSIRQNMPRALDACDLATC